MTTTTVRSAPVRRNRLMIGVGAVFLAVGLILGTVFVLIGSKDYSGYTARAAATVVDVDVHTTRSNGKTRTSRDYDVQFTVDGRTYRVDDIGGVRSGGDLSTGNVVAVAFPPQQPLSAVWASTVEGGAAALLRIGLAAGLLFGGLGAVILALGLRRRPVRHRQFLAQWASTARPSPALVPPTPEPPPTSAGRGRSTRSPASWPVAPPGPLTRSTGPATR